MESKKINQLATELAPDLSDLTIIGDPTTGISKKITLSQMASLFTGTVEEYANFAAFPLVGVADTIYIAKDTNVIYRWDSTAYVVLSPNIIASLVFNDANGFDGTIALVGSVATLTITTALTSGSVPFIGASGALTQDNANLFFDDTNNRLGINTNAPTTALDVFGSGIIGRINGTSTNNAYLGFSSNGTNKWSAGNVQSDHRFRIFSEANSAELISVLQTGEFGIGIANPTTKLHIDGGASALIANLDANVSVAKSVSFRSDNSNRFNIEVSGTESGSNAGADLFIRRYSDAGSLIDTPLTITRSTGNATFSGILITPQVKAATSAGLSINANSGTQVADFGAGGSANITFFGGLSGTSASFSSTATATAFIPSGATIPTNGMYLSAANTLDFATNTTNRLTITSAGNVGIGTISPNIGGYGGNGRVLTIQGVSGSYGVLELTSNSANADGSAIGRLDFGSDGQAANYKAISSIASFLSGSTSTKFGADLRFYTRADNAASGDSVERMRITSAGYVLIGATSSSGIGSTRLQVSGTSTTSQILATNTSGGFFSTYTTSNDVYMTRSDAGSVLYIGTGPINGSTFTEQMRITSGGLVGIGTSSPITPLSLVASVTNSQISTGSLEIQSFGTNNSWIADNLYYNNGFKARVTGYTSQIYFNTAGGIGFFTNNGQTTAGATSSLGQRMEISASGAVTIAGSLSKGSGSFRIEHPLESLSKTHQLVHSFIEGPQADLIYRGKLTLVNGKAQANIDEVSTMTDGTFVALCREVQCFTTNESGWDLVKGKVIGNIIYIESQNPNSTDEISWMVIGERKDKHMMDTEWTDENGRVIVEPLKVIKELPIIEEEIISPIEL